MIAVSSDSVKVINVPHYESLTVDEIVTQGKRYKELDAYWPDERDMQRIGRSWLCNLIYTVAGSRF